MNNLLKIGLLLVIGLLAPGRAAAQKVAKYKCMLQMNSYVGEKAYIVVSLVNAKGEYEKTLAVMGGNKRWYFDLKEWHKYYKKKQPDISAITGASVTGGDRSVTVLEISPSKINKGYTIRFESAVEDNKYYVKDAEVALTTEGLEARTEGTGYIKYVRFSAN